MNQETIIKIFKEYNLGAVDNIVKINIGFTNHVYDVNNKYILKVCFDKKNESNFEKEVYFYSLFAGKIPVPKVLVYDRNKRLYDKFFMIYPKIIGDNLYSVWHIMSIAERKEIIKQLCGLLKIVNKEPVFDYAKKFNEQVKINWKEKVVSSIYKSLSELDKNNFRLN